MDQAIVRRNKPSLFRRLDWAVKAFQMRFSGYGGSWGQSWGSGWNRSSGTFSNSGINYAAEAGELHNSSIVMAAVNWLGRVLPEAPLQVLQVDSKGKEEPIPNHPAVALFKRPNPFYSGASLWKTFALDWIISGNVYFAKIRKDFNRVFQLWYLPSWMVCPRWLENSLEFISYYEYQVDGQLIRILPKDIIHFRDGADPKNMGRTGLSPVASVLREICADNEVAVYQYLLLKAGGVPPVALSLKDGQSSDEFNAAEVKQTYIRATTGDERGKVFVSNMAVELTKLGFSPDELDMKDLRHMPESRFASVIGIAKETLGYGAADENSTYNNVEQADERSIKSYVKPLWDYIEDELTHQLGPDFDIGDDSRFDFDISEIGALQEDQNALHERANKDLGSGGITVNEYRTMIGMPAVDDGNVYLRSTSVQAVSPEMVGASIEAALNPPEMNNPDEPFINGRDTETVN